MAKRKPTRKQAPDVFLHDAPNERLPIGQVKGYERNPRIHRPAQVRKIAASMEEFGWTVPILLDNQDVIIAGHGRLAAALHLGLTEVLACRLEHLTENQVRAYRIADNRLTEQGEWDEDLLRSELTTVEASPDVDLEVTGFDLSDLDRPLLEEEDAPAASRPPADPITKPGDLWQLGRHRLICGDATSPEDHKRLLAGNEPFLMVTDPPYGVNYDPSWREKHDVKSTDYMFDDSVADWGQVYELSPCSVLYIWHGTLKTVEVATGIQKAGYDLRAVIIWVKPQQVIARGAYNWQHEGLFYAERHHSATYAVRRDESARWIGGPTESTVWHIGSQAQEEDDTPHAAQKPVECMERPIRNHKGDVFDPFLGSGTTILAAENQKRTCYAIEQKPAFCDIAIQRYQKMTGQAARNEETGQEFPL